MQEYKSFLIHFERLIQQDDWHINQMTLGAQTR